MAIDRKEFETNLHNLTQAGDVGGIVRLLEYARANDPEAHAVYNPIAGEAIGRIETNNKFGTLMQQFEGAAQNEDQAAMQSLIDQMQGMGFSPDVQKQAQERMQDLQRSALDKILLKQLKSTAGEYEKSLPGQAFLGQEAAGSDIRRELGQQQEQITQAANRRGLLYSGLKQGAEVEAQAGAGAKAQSSQRMINDQLRAQADALNKIATTQYMKNQGAVMEEASQKQASSVNQYNADIANQQKKQQAQQKLFGAVGSGLGMAGGIAAANASSKKTANTDPVDTTKLAEQTEKDLNKYKQERN
jgi:hypothetical protein